MATPLHMALVASAVANDGKMMQPILVKEVEDAKGSAIEEHKPKVLAESTSSDIAKTLTKYMVSVVQDGTGRRASLRSTQVAGKTGSAENASGENHAWFIGFAPAKDPQIAVAVILEQAGKSGAVWPPPLPGTLSSMH